METRRRPDAKLPKWRFMTTKPLNHHHILSNHRPLSFYWFTEMNKDTHQHKPRSCIYIHTEMFNVTSHLNPTLYPDNSGDNIGLCNLQLFL
ncbi:hypothetical protein HID58_019243 [Brassica napus]|uniref:Uncharacterized protein n=1 Tax=Brassica napus TaxID=3708 RepID=A0ABQ8DCB6_BRANA|nr:hypothetical protein HID58_019243 [Brassica napus]